MPLTNPYNPYQPYTAGLPYYPQMPNPYQTQSPMPKLDNIGQTQQAPNTPQSIFGHVVSNESEIKPNEVPMDGSIALFPLSDFTSIIAKQWSQDGTIKTLKFVPNVARESKDRLGYIPEMDSEYGLYYDGDDEDFQNAEKWRKSKRMRNGIRAEEELDPRYGKSFNDYRKAKKYYTETHSTESKHRMDQDAENHLSESIDAFKEIWVDADPDLKQHIKSELSSLISSMVI